MKNLNKFLISFVLTLVLFQTLPCQIFAQEPPAATTSPAPAASGDAAALQAKTLDVNSPDSQAIIGAAGAGAGNWQPDDEVTFTGKLAARSEDVLDWLLENYQWARFSGTTTPFDNLWSFIRNTVFAVLGLFILVGAFLMIITRGRSLTVKRLIIRFVMVLILVIFSYSIVRTIYALADIVQGFFLFIS